MKRLIYLTSLFTCLTASSLNIIKYKDEGNDVFHMILKSDSLIKCLVSSDYRLQDNIKCNFSEPIDINKSIKSEYFELKIKKKEIDIYPKYKYKIFVDNKPIYDKKTFNQIKNYNKFDVLFFKVPPSYIKDDKLKNSLDFDINYNEIETPFIDVLNDNLTPVVSLKEASKIDFIKKLYKKGDFDSVIKKADMELKNNNLYSSEILLYKIRALDKLLEDKNEMDYDFSDLISSCEKFIESFPSNKDLTEVFFYEIKSLYKKGKYKKATFLTDKLVKNFPNDRFAQKASILKAKNLYNKPKSKRYSYKLLKDILYSTKYLDVALESATILVEQNLNDKRADDAKVFLEKILNYKDYIKKNKKRFYNYAKKFAKLKYYDEAIKIASILKESSEDEELLKNLAFWEEKAKMSDKAYKDYMSYLKKYPDGQFKNFVQERIDKVLIDINETNTSKKINDIDKILKNYSKEPIYKKALIEKVKLLIKNKKYNEVLEMSDKLKDINETKYIDISAQKLLYDYLEKHSCIRSIKIVDKYKVNVDADKLYLLAQCFYETARYKESLELATKYLKSKSFDNSVKWYYLGIKSASKIKNYNLVIKLYEDLIKIIDKNNIPLDINFDIFTAYMGLKYIDKALLIVQVIEEKDPNYPKLLDIYYQILKYYKDKKQDLTVVLYGKKILKLQKKLKSYVYSPIVDIYTIKSLSNLNKYKDALKIFADAYLNKNVTSSQKAQLLYLAGEISLKINNIKQAREFFIKCGTDAQDELWQKLCSESLKLIEDK